MWSKSTAKVRRMDGCKAGGQRVEQVGPLAPDACVSLPPSCTPTVNLRFRVSEA